MLGNLTIETSFSDTSLLYSVLNAVAMVSKETTWIWSFAVMVSMWTIVRATTAASLGSTGDGGAKLAKGSLDVILPLVLAMILTTPALKSTVVIESTRTGKIATVDNVPDAVALLPAAASKLGTDLRLVMRTAFSGVNADYTSISASDEGMINPLKVLLTSRSATMKLGSVDSLVRSVVGACIGYDSGADYAKIINKVRTTGPTSYGSTISIKGSNSAAISQLLYQASLNTTGFVPDVAVDAGEILTCAEGAAYAAQQIESALDSQEFKRVVLGSSSSSENPSASGDYSFDRLVLQWSSTRKSTAVTNVLAGGTTQATTEVLNLFFDEIVSSNLNCLRADGPNRTTCQAASIQALEIERTNVSRAATTAQSQAYAGAFAEYMLALVLGLGPVLILFMMFMGTNASKAMYMAAHVTVWPLLVMNVGNELINGMVYTQLADFLNTITQGGYLTQPLAIEAYKEFSKQIGVTSIIQSSLPVLLSMIFALGASSASVSVANKTSSESSKASSLSTPEMQSSAPVVKTGSMATIEQGAGGWSKVSETGSTQFVQQSATYGEHSQQHMRAQQQEVSRQRVISEGESFTNAILEKSGNTDSRLKGVDRSTAHRISENARRSLAQDESSAASSSVTGSKDNSNTSVVGAGVSASASAGFQGLSAKVSASTRTDTAAQSRDSLSQSEQSRKEDSLRKSKAVESAIASELANTTRTSSNQSQVKALESTLQKQQQYSQTITESASERDTSSKSKQTADKLVAFSQNIGIENLAQHADVNKGYQAFLLQDGRKFEQLPGAKQHLAAAREQFESGGVDRVLGSPMAKAAALNHNAAVRLYNDKGATNDDRAAAANYLTGQGLAISGMSPPAQTIDQVKTTPIDKPEDATGASSRNLESRAPKLSPLPTGHSAQIKAGGSARRPATPASNPTDGIATLRAELQGTTLGQVSNAFERAADAGLTQNDSKGTGRRVASVVKENLVTAVTSGANKKVTLAEDQPKK